MSKLAGDILADMAQAGAALKAGEKMCSGCAFRPGTQANNDLAFTQSVLAAMPMKLNFQCHMANKRCAGYQYAEQYCKAFDSEQ